MTENTPAEADAEPNRSITDRLGTDWTPYLKAASAAVFGLTVNALVISLIIGGGILSIVDGVAYLTPVTALAAALYQRYNPLEMNYLGPSILFLTFLLANMVTLTVRVIQTVGSPSDVLVTFLLVGFVALMFTPGPFLGTYAARRWWI